MLADFPVMELHDPRHIIGVDVRQHHLSGFPMSAPFLNVWCSCGWSGDPMTITELTGSDGSIPVAVGLDDIPEAVLEEAARSWRYHVRLSNRIEAVDRRLRQAAARAPSQVQEE